MDINLLSFVGSVALHRLPCGSRWSSKVKLESPNVLRQALSVFESCNTLPDILDMRSSLYTATKRMPHSAFRVIFDIRGRHGGWPVSYCHRKTHRVSFGLRILLSAIVQVSGCQM